MRHIYFISKSGVESVSSSAALQGKLANQIFQMKFSTLTIRTVCLFFLLQFAMALQALAYESVSWVEESLIHDGRLLKVERKASNSLQLEVYWVLPPAFRFQPSSFDEHRIEFRHPDTNERVVWSGERHFTPVRVDIIDRTPYLVIHGRPDKKTERIYGCPELPYIYLKYNLNEWSPVPLDTAPQELAEGNLSVYDVRAKNGRSLNWKDVEHNVKFFEKQSYGQMQARIPRSYDEWHTKFKNSQRNDRQFGDCRPPRVPPPQLALPAAVEGAPEILETIEYLPTRTVIGEEWGSLVFDQARERACKKIFRPTDPDDQMQGQRFVNDKTGSKLVPYSKSAQFDMGVRVLCDEHVWFFTHQEEPGKMVVTKFTTTGDFVYRTSFRQPGRVDGFTGYIRIPSLKSEAGYLYFDWIDFREINREWHIRRWLKMRMKEPDLSDPVVQGAQRK